MKRPVLTAILLLAAVLPSAAGSHRTDTLEVTEFSNEYLDTVKVYRKRTINDYSMIGVNYGVALCNMAFNPSKHNRAWQVCPNHFSVMYTHYEKLFGYIANFAFHAGFAYSHEGAGFKIDPETGSYYNNIDYANTLKMDIVEVPVMAGFHFDVAPVKFEACVGVYAGYRLSIEREGVYLQDEWKTTFHDYDFRFDYGLEGGAGIAFMIDPIELHFNATLRWGWQSMYEPNYYSEYYYRYAYPLDIIVTAGIHFQLSKRTGKTSKELKRQAKEAVYGKTGNIDR